MGDHPILFSAPMVRALLDGRKTQTRRVLKPQPPADMGLVGIYAPKLTAVFGYETPDADHKIALRYMPGDRLWVREAHYLTDDGDYEQVVYAVDTDAVEDHFRQMDDLARRYPSVDWSRHRKLRPSIHMPRWASRLTLIVTDVRVQRLYEISADDVHAEGVEWGVADYRDRFHQLWDALNASRGYGWDTLPWVVAISFTVDQQNIDQIGRAA